MSDKDAYLDWLARRPGMSRREFIGRATALGLTTALATTMAGKAGLAAEPKKGGSLRLGMSHGATTDSLDPGTYPDTFTQTAFYGAMSNGLTDVDAKGNVFGDVAETMEPSDDAKKWVFKIRKGMTFHNGKTVDSTDVVESYRHHMGADSKSAAKS